MIKIFRLCFTLFFVQLGLNAQSRLLIETGYFTDVFFEAEDAGFSLTGEYGYKMKNDIWINAKITQAETRLKKYSNIGLSTNAGTNTSTYRIFGVDFSKDFQFKNKHIIYPSLGMIYHQWVLPTPQYEVYVDESYNLIFENFAMDAEVWHDVGFNFDINYRYQLLDGVFLGVSSGVNYLITLGFVGLFVTPAIEFRL